MFKVLDAATKLKMTHEEDDENKIILKAITDVNLPKFSSSDTKLFQVYSVHMKFLHVWSNYQSVSLTLVYPNQEILTVCTCSFQISAPCKNRQVICLITQSCINCFNS